MYISGRNTVDESLDEAHSDLVIPLPQIPAAWDDVGEIYIYTVNQITYMFTKALIDGKFMVLMVSLMGW